MFKKAEFKPELQVQRKATLNRGKENHVEWPESLEELREFIYPSHRRSSNRYKYSVWPEDKWQFICLLEYMQADTFWEDHADGSRDITGRPGFLNVVSLIESDTSGTLTTSRICISEKQQPLRQFAFTLLPRDSHRAISFWLTSSRIFGIWPKVNIIVKRFLLYEWELCTQDEVHFQIQYKQM